MFLQVLLCCYLACMVKNGKAATNDSEVAPNDNLGEGVVDSAFSRNCPRVTTSEEERLDKYGTFNSISESDESSDKHIEKSKDTDQSSGSSGSGKKKSGKKAKKGKKQWPSNMNPKERRKKKTQGKSDAAQTKRKELVQKIINGDSRVNFNVKKNGKGKENSNHNNKLLDGTDIQMKKERLTGEKINNLGKAMHVDIKTQKTGNVGLKSQIFSGRRPGARLLVNVHDGNSAVPNKANLNPLTNSKAKHVQSKQKNVSIFEKFMGVCQLTHKHTHDEKYQRSQQHLRHLQPGDQRPRPYV